MKPSRQQLLDIIWLGLREEGANPPEPPPADLDSLRLIGRDALVRSVGLVALLVGLEQRLAEEFHVEVSLMDERAMSQSRSPFRSVAALLEHLGNRVAEHR